MGRVRTIARRTFLIGSTAILGGVAFGTYMVQRPTDNPLADDLASGEATFNPWVKVTSDGITLIGPHADKGQGVASSQAALIAEEMDLDFGQFQVSFGEPSGAYWNTGMAEEGVPFKATDESFMARNMRSMVGGLMKIMQLQGTGGSTTMPDSFDKLRHAGAVARETLKLAAAQQTGTPVDRTVIISLEAIEAIHVDWKSGARTSGPATPAEVIRQMDLTPKAVTAVIANRAIFGV